MTADRDTSLLRRVFVLTMVSFSANMKPTIFLNHLDDLTDFHPRMMRSVSLSNQSPITQRSAKTTRPSFNVVANWRRIDPQQVAERVNGAG
jgi:hypothetical protein